MGSYYKCMTADGLSKFLCNQTLQFTSLNFLNDPYESLLNMKVFLEAYLLELDRKLNVPDQYGIVDMSLTKALLSKKPANEISDNIISNTYIHSLSTNNDNLLMRAHYADKHTGAVVEFDADNIFFAGHESFDTDFITQIEKVKYTNHRTMSIVYRNDDLLYRPSLMEPIRHLLHTKGTSWAYEDEYRQLHFHKPNQNDSLSVFNVRGAEKHQLLKIDVKNIVKCIYLGVNFDRHTMEYKRIAKYISKYSLNCKSAILIDNEYKIEFV